MKERGGDNKLRNNISLLKQKAIMHYFCKIIMRNLTTDIEDVLLIGHICVFCFREGKDD